MSNNPDEILTVYQCPSCDHVGVADHERVDAKGLFCSECDDRLKFADLYDYVDFRVVEYE